MNHFKMPPKTHCAALLSLLTLSFVAACGDEDSDTGSSVNGSKGLLELTEVENQKLCSYYERTFKDSLGSEEQYCTTQALFGVTSAAECEGYKAECIAADEYADDIGEGWHCEQAKEGHFVSDGATECGASVAEFEACIEQDAARWKELAKYSCTQAQEANYPIDLAPACKTLTEKCPDVNL